MNQQRSRRFRTAQEAKENVEKALRRGEEIPDSPPFDSNCITPGTLFMRKLSLQLEYFIAKKVSEDSNWRNVQVILSGHETCGEGEHKIMEFIRTLKAQPEYDPNTRHCLYGLDADLIMLGLLSHDPHFALLREEVVFGPRRAKKSDTLESQTFYLLHISLLREYLELEFDGLRKRLPFGFDLEKIIDDYILLHLFVGNDFLPHLPGLHINEGAIEMLFQIYQRILPQAGGYLNEQGTLRPERLQLVINELCKFERDNFVREHLPNIRPPSEKKYHVKQMLPGQMVVHRHNQLEIERLYKFILKYLEDPKNALHEIFFTRYQLMSMEHIIHDMAKALDLELIEDDYDPETDNLGTWVIVPMSVQKAIKNGEDLGNIPFLKKSKEDVRRAMHPYLAARVYCLDYEQMPSLLELEKEEHELSIYNQTVDEKMSQFKKGYYQQKMELKSDKESIHDLVYNYIEGMQWVLHYYYEGNASWGWFYRYHYAPRVSDLTEISDFKFQFDLGKPFLPFEQLMGVLPPLSKQLIPPAFQDLMTDPSSSIIDFYPEKYESDMNGKKNSWEAVVKIPFIEEKRLLEALHRRENLLTSEERERNCHAPPKIFSYDVNFTHKFPSSMPGFLPDLPDNRTRIQEYSLPSMVGKTFVKTLPEGVNLGLDAMPGFPSLKTLPFEHRLVKMGVNVHGHASNDSSMAISVGLLRETKDAKDVTDMIGQTTYIHWPYLFEGIIVAISDHRDVFRAHWLDNDVKIRRTEGPETGDGFRKLSANLSHHYNKRYGVNVGFVSVLLHVRPLKGLSRGYDGSIVKQYEPDPSTEVAYPLHMAVKSLRHPDTRFLESPAMSVSEEYKDGDKVFFLGSRGFGCPARVIGTASDTITIELAFISDMAQEHAILQKLVQQRAQDPYFSAADVAKRLRMSSLVLSKITSSVIMLFNKQKINIGLNLKFEAKSRKVLGYTRRTHTGWEYSEHAVRLVAEYQAKFPEITRALARRLSDGEYNTAQEIFGDKAEARIKELRAWFKAHDIKDLEVVPLHVERLQKPIISTLESAVTLIAQRRVEQGAVKRQILRGLPREALLKPEQARFRVPEQMFHLGDRVINVLDFGFVPLAAKGTVVGIGANSVDVVFDAPFLAGTSLDGACSSYRGATVGRAHVLNLTMPQIATEWGEMHTSEAHLTPLQRTLKIQRQEKQTKGQRSMFYQPAPQKKQADNPKRGLGSGRPRPSVDATTSHLQTLSLSKPVKPNAWSKQRPVSTTKATTEGNISGYGKGSTKGKPHQSKSRAKEAGNGKPAAAPNSNT